MELRPATSGNLFLHYLEGVGVGLALGLAIGLGEGVVASSFTAGVALASGVSAV